MQNASQLCSSPFGSPNRRISGYGLRLRLNWLTSLVSALFDERNPERKSLTETFFGEIANFESFISEITVAEIERTPDIGLRNKMKDAVRQFSFFPVTDEVEWLADQYIRHGAL